MKTNSCADYIQFMSYWIGEAIEKLPDMAEEYNADVTDAENLWFGSNRD